MTEELKTMDCHGFYIFLVDGSMESVDNDISEVVGHCFFLQTMTPFCDKAIFKKAVA